MAPTALLLVLLLVLVVNVAAFKHCGLRRQATTSVFRRPVMVTASPEVAGAYQQIKDKALGSLAGAGAAIPATYSTMLSTFLEEYSESCMTAKVTPDEFKFLIFTWLKGVQTALTAPHKFAPFHKSMPEEYKWGNAFIKPLIIGEESRIVGVDNARRIVELIEKGENVVILSNHQTEVDPQVLSILLEKEGLGHVAEKMVFMAGHKVTTDPVAIPFSLGRNLVCIHSKKHIKNPPEQIPEKQAQNLASMQAMSELINTGGTILWVAPSGGRDRPDPESSKFVVAPFDGKTLDMFKIIQMQSKRPMHFFPMAMYTNRLVPPPKDVSSDLGEVRSAKRGAVSVEFLAPTNGLGGLKDKEFAQELQSNVEKSYASLAAWHGE